ncbi:MAG TPA: hypothetical protein VHL11_13270, partial [Phototrophicaceae bacterium]|nr:hypothetical protein [Phototrophicaceae bacterium]
MDFQFEPKNFLVGILAGWVSAFVFVQAREVVRSLREAGAERANRAQTYTGAEARYVSELTKFCEVNHVAGATVELSKILVEPRFIPMTPLAMPPEDDPNRDPFRVVPIIHDYPYLHAPYNIDTASIREISSGDRALALLGLPGSGRTTALQAIALWSLGVVDFKPPKDKVQIQLEAEEAALKADERAARIKEYLELEDRARERLAEEQGEDYDASTADAKKSGLPLLKRMMPVYVHLANLNPEDGGRRADPAEPLVRAVQYQSGNVTAKTLPRHLYERLNRGGSVVLLDGFDDLSPQEQRRRLPWLKAFVREYRRNFIIITGALDGYGALTRVGFTPVFLRSWQDLHISEAAENWANHWSKITGSRRRDNERPAERLVNGAKAGSLRLTPFEMTLRLRAIYNEELQTESVSSDSIQTYLRALGVEGDPLTKAAQAAALQLDEGFITASRLHDVLMGLPAPTPEAEIISSETDQSDAFVLMDGEAEDNPSSKAASAPKKAPATKKSGKPASATREVAQVLKLLESKGLLRRYRGDHYLFRYSHIAAYLASLILPTLSPEVVRMKAMVPA